MWLDNAATIFGILSTLALLYFLADVLAWTFGAAWIPPLDALLRFGVWSLCLCSSLFWHSKLSLRFKQWQKREGVQ